jgi:hypothetical protein
MKIVADSRLAHGESTVSRMIVASKALVADVGRQTSHDDCSVGSKLLVASMRDEHWKTACNFWMKRPVAD